jgi:hypothetical protein
MKAEHVGAGTLSLGAPQSKECEGEGHDQPRPAGSKEIMLYSSSTQETGMPLTSQS